LGAEQQETLVVGGAPEVGVLGELRLTVAGQMVNAGPRLQRCLLGILIVELDRVVPVDRLIDLLWGEEPPGAAVASVQAYVSQLRRILEPGRAARSPARVLVTRDPGYVLRLAPDQVDAYRFLSLSRAGRELLAEGYAEDAAVRLDLALDEWRGEPFVEFAAERWAIPMVARLTEAYDATCEDRIDAWLTLGRHSEAVPVLEEMVKAKPFRERRWGQLILANYRSGSQAEALRAFQRCRTALGEELGIEAGPELRRLESAVLAQDPSLDWRPVAVGEGIRIWPPPPSASVRAEAVVVDRDQPAAIVRATHLERIRERLEQTAGNRGGVVVLVGEPGVGKTTLAEQATQTAVAAGARVAWSRCPDAAAAPAYWPWIQVLRELPDNDDTRAALARLLGEERTTEGVSDAGAALFRAYQAVLFSLRSVSSVVEPLVVVLDDIHAADTASLALLELVAGDLHRLPVLFVLTLRDTEPSDALDRTLGELLRHPGVERLAARRSTRTEWPGWPPRRSATRSTRRSPPRSSTAPEATSST
jgi:DNA-binding SARP family transcriptional activator